MKKILVFLFATLISISVAVGCSKTVAELDGTLSEIVEKACAASDFSSVSFTYMQDDFSDEILMYMYGVEDDTLIDYIDDFVLCQRSGVSAATFAVIRFKDGTDDSVIDAVKTAVVDTYVKSLENALLPYDPTQYSIAKNYDLRTVGNSIVLVICEDTDAVFDAITK